jgi:hypothetical protein
MNGAGELTGSIDDEDGCRAKDVDDEAVPTIKRLHNNSS